MPAAAKTRRDRRHIDVIAGRAGDELHPAAGGDQYKNGVGVEQIAQLVRDR